MDFFKPKIFTTIKTYNKEQFFKDAISGFIVAIIALPLSIALAIASGVSPEKGIHTAIIAGFLISLLGGSRVQIGGPTGAFMVIIYGIILEYGMDGLIAATFMAGIIIIIMGICRLGGMIKYIPYPVTSGFTSGIAVTIFVSQMKDFFGFEILEKMPADFIGKISMYIKYIDTVNYEALLISGSSLLILLVWPIFCKKIPGAIVVLVASSLIVKFLSLDVVTIGEAFTTLNDSLPVPNIPNLDWHIMRKMLMPAIAIAILGSIESLLSAVVADGIIGTRHRSNTELIGQGIANIASAIFGGLPATGAIARTVTNINNGGRTPIAGILHSIYLFIIMILFLPLAKMIPLASLAAILVVVSINMGDWGIFKRMLSAPKSDSFILFTVFFITIVFDLILAIEIGMVMASFLFMKRMSDMTNIKISSFDASEDDEGSDDIDETSEDMSSKGIYIYEINGPFFFGAADKFIETINNINIDAKVIVFRMRYVNSIDATATHVLKRMINVCENREIKLILCELNKQPLKILKQTSVIKMVGEENVYENFEELKAKVI